MSKSVHTKAYESLRRLLVDTRLERELTQGELATKLRKPQSYVSKYERGERRLDVVEFIQVARALDQDPAELMRRLPESPGA